MLMRTLLEGLLFKGNSFKKTLTATYSLPPAEAENVVLSAGEIIKALNEAGDAFTTGI